MNINFYCIFTYGIFGFYLNNLNYVQKYYASSLNRLENETNYIRNKDAFESMADYFFNVFSNQNENFSPKKIMNNVLGISFILHLLISFKQKSTNSNNFSLLIGEKINSLIEIFQTSKTNIIDFSSLNLIKENSKIYDDLHFLRQNEGIFQNLTEHYK